LKEIYAGETSALWGKSKVIFYVRQEDDGRWFVASRFDDGEILEEYDELIEKAWKGIPVEDLVTGRYSDKGVLLDDEE
jgi:hypothetical protein